MYGPLTEFVTTRQPPVSPEPVLISKSPFFSSPHQNMNKQYVGRDFSKTQATDKLTPDKVDAAADAHMPLCMKVR
jgi:hypothetical protein